MTIVSLIMVKSSNPVAHPNIPVPPVMALYSPVHVNLMTNNKAKKQVYQRHYFVAKLLL